MDSSLGRREQELFSLSPGRGLGRGQKLHLIKSTILRELHADKIDFFGNKKSNQFFT
jgi:hypothetical protein